MPKIKISPTITGTEIGWIIQALNHEVTAYREEVASSESDVIRNLGKLAIENRTKLVTKLTDLVNAGAKSVNII